MKLYLNDEKSHVDPCPHIGILLGLDSNDQDHCGISSINIPINMVPATNVYYSTYTTVLKTTQVKYPEYTLLMRWGVRTLAHIGVTLFL